MKYSGLYKKRKWHRHSRIPLAAMLVFSVLTAALFFTIRYRFNRVLEYVVREESGGKYAFQSDKMNVSLLHKRIIMERAKLICLDSTDEISHYDLNIPQIYFSISSWKELLMNQKIVIDSFSIIRPDFSIQVRKPAVARQTRPFRPGIMLDYLEQTLQHLNAHSLSIQDASVTYGWFDDPQPLHVNQISLSLTNFTHVNNDDSHLFGSDKVAFSLGRQHWVLADSSREISFRSLSFRSSDQRMEIDSFAYHQWPGEDRTTLDIRAEKFFFNSHHIPAIYQKSELLIDTLFCYRPVFSIPGKDPGKMPAQQVMQTVTKAAEPVFKFINIKFIGIDEAALIQTDRESVSQNVISSRTNLRIYNLTSDPSKRPPVTTDSIRLSVHQIHFYSADSLFKLDIDEFSFNKNDLIFSNVIFGPSEFNTSPRTMHFRAPSLVLHHINLEALTHKRIAASSAELIQPEFIFQDNRQHPRSPNSVRSKENGKMKGAYQTLHSLQELISVPDFRITRGKFLYHSSGLQAIAGHIDAQLLPDKLFQSDSLVDFKDAIAYFHIGHLELKSKEMAARLNGFAFNGPERTNHSDSVDLRLANGTHIAGTDIHWKSLDWELLQQSKQIRTDQLTIGALSVTSISGLKKTGPEKPLPVLDIRDLKIKKADFSLRDEKKLTSFALSDAGLSDVKSDKQKLVWGRARFILHDFLLKDSNKEIIAARLVFDNEGETRISGFRLLSQQANGRTEIRAPLVVASLPVHQSDFSRIEIPRLAVENALVNLNVDAGPDTGARSFEMPVSLSFGSMEWNHLQLNYRMRKGRDSTRIQFLATIHAKDFKTFRSAEKIAQYQEVASRVSGFNIDRPGIHGEAPDMELIFKNGMIDFGKNHSLVLKSDLAMSWNNGYLHYLRDSTAIQSSGIAGNILIPGITWEKGKARDLSDLATNATIHGRQLSCKGKTTNLHAGGYSWNGSRRELSLEDFEMLPVLDREQSFKTAAWQKDYMEAKGRRLVITGLHLPSKNGDSVFRVGQLDIEGVSLATWRDRRVPFRHGLEKPMPTRLIASLGFPIIIDTIRLHNNDIRVHEYSTATERWSDMPIDSLSGYIANVKSRSNDQDRLSLLVSARFYHNPIRRFSYSESYGDSLSAFRASLLMTRADLHHFNKLSMALADVGIRSGYADTIATDWSGNKYAATGHLHLSFQKLSIKLYNKKDTAKWAFLPAVETGVANLYLLGGRNKTSFLYFERDREKFVFNYWVKTQAQGFLAVLGLKSSRKYLKEYNQHADEYGLERK